MAKKPNEQKNTFLQFSRFVLGAFFAFLLIVIMYAFSSPLRGLLVKNATEQTATDVTDNTPVSDEEPDDPIDDEETITYPYRQDTLLTEVNRDDVTLMSAASFNAEHIALLCCDDMTLLASLDADERIHPASMTKVMTLLVAAEHVTSLDEEVPVKGELFNKYADLLTGTEQFITYQYEEGVPMTVPVKTLLYLIGMESAADATLMLTDYLAGSPEEFVNWMNQKAADLHLRDTHFTNAIGIYDEDLYSTALDMAVIMANAMEIDIVAEVLSTAETGSPFVFNGKTINFWPKHTLLYDFYNKNKTYSRELTDGFYVEAAKTGTESYKVDKKNTVYIKALVSVTSDAQNRRYILVTVSESSSEVVLKDLVTDLNTVYQNAALYIKQ